MKCKKLLWLHTWIVNKDLATMRLTVLLMHTTYVHDMSMEINIKDN